MPPVQLGLVVKSVHLADAAVHEELNHAAHLGAMMQPSVQIGSGRGSPACSSVLASSPSRPSIAARAIPPKPPPSRQRISRREICSIMASSHRQFTYKNSLLLIDQTAQIRQSVPCWRRHAEQFDLLGGRACGRRPARVPTSLFSRARPLPCSAARRTLALAEDKRVVQELEGLKRRGRLVAHSRQLRGVGGVEGIEERVGKRAEDKAIDAAPAEPGLFQSYWL